MKKLIFFLKKHWFATVVFLILFLATILRFYNYENRWGLAYDQARDVLVARHALATHKIPLIGPFASAGQFVYGPQWFWILMVMISMYPHAILTPWIIQTALYIVMVFVMVLIGKEIGGKFLGVLLGLLTTVSPMQISYSTNLISPSMVSIFSILSVYFFVKFIKKEKNLDGFLMALSVATAVNIHFQAIGLLILVPVSFLFGSHGFKKIMVLIIGTVIPFVPLIIFDLQNNFFESRNWLDYYLYGQYRIYVPNRWLTYIGIYWPTMWGKIIGGSQMFGYAIIASLAVFSFYLLIKRKIPKLLLSIMASFLCMVVLLRYYRGERVDIYTIFLHPFVLLLTSWIVYKFFIWNRVVGLILLLLLFIGSIQLTFTEIQNATNFTDFQASEWKKELIHTFPDKKFAIYDLNFGTRGKSLPLVLYLDMEKKIDDKGLKVGLFIATSDTHFKYPSIFGRRGEYQILNLNDATDEQLSKEGWAFVNPSAIYNSTEEWYKQ